MEFIVDIIQLVEGKVSISIGNLFQAYLFIIYYYYLFQFIWRKQRESTF